MERLQYLRFIDGDDKLNLNKTIRAVVELHKPFNFKLGEELFISCQGCGETPYPCLTIQAIEKELL